MAEELQSFERPSRTDAVITGGGSKVIGDTPRKVSEKENEFEGISFQDNPERFCKAVYDEFKKHNDSQHNRIVDNRSFYEGLDPDLEDIKANPKVVRSAVFDNEVRPSWDSVRATIIDSLSEYELPLKLIANEGSQDDPELISSMEMRLNQELRDGGFFDSKIEDMLIEAASSPVVSCKVGWETKEGWVYEKYPPLERPLRMAMNFLQGNGFNAGLKKKWGIEKDGPVVDVLDYDEFLYDQASNELSSCRVLCHAQMKIWSEFMDMAEDRGWDRKAIKQMEQERNSIVGDGTVDAGEDTLTGKAAAELDGNREAYYKDGRVLIVEFWVPTYDNEGRPETRVFYLGANKYKLNRQRNGDRSEWDKIAYPFAILRFNKQFNRIEGTPPIETVKSNQKLVNDYTNAINDGFTYGIFSPIIKDKRTKFEKQPTYGPGEFWECEHPEGLKPLNAGTRIPDLAILLSARQEQQVKIRQILNAPDTAQGTETANDQEKATKTRLREAGSMRRARINHKLVGGLIIKVAQMYMYMHQANDEEEWLLDVTLDVPALTGASSPLEEKETAIILYEMTQDNPVYNNPIGLVKQRNLFADILDRFRVRDKDRVLPTEEEIKIVSMIAQQIEAAAAAEEAGGNPGQNDVVAPAGETEREVANA